MFVLGGEAIEGRLWTQSPRIGSCVLLYRHMLIIYLSVFLASEVYGSAVN